MTPSDIDDLLRPLVPQVIGALVRRYGHFDLAEDATQEALVAAAAQWPGEGAPDNPRSWLITVASRRLTDLLRSEQARRGREDREARWQPSDAWVSPGADTAPTGDDSLILLFMCCNQELPAASQMALTLRAVAGLSTAEIARALLTSESAATRRITRAKTTIRESATPFRMPIDYEYDDRLAAVLHVLYLVFNEGYRATAGHALLRADLSLEAIRLTRMLHAHLPDDPEASGLLALMLLTDARRPARVDAHGDLVPMAEQDRTLWDGDKLHEGGELIASVLPRGPVGPYQLQAAIAAVHGRSRTADETDWPQIVALYRLLEQVTDSPVVALNHAVAVAMVRGPGLGLERIEELRTDPRLATDHRLHAVRGHLLELVGDVAGARSAFEHAAELTHSLPHQRYLNGRAAKLSPPRGDS